MANILNIAVRTSQEWSGSLSLEFNTNQWDEQYIEDINRNDFVNMKSDIFFDKVLDFPLEKENVYFAIIGSDSGLLLPWLVKQPLGRGSKIVVIEHDDVYQSIFSNYRGMLSGGDKNSNYSKTIELYSHTQWLEEILESIETTYLFAGKIYILESHASSSDYSRLYMPILKSIRTSTREHLSKTSITINRDEFTKKQFENIVDNFTPVVRSLEFGKNKTAIILGGGPSLDLHLDWVIENSQYLFIFAISRNAAKLMDRGLVPDAVVSVDPYDVSYEISKKGILWTDVPLFYNYHVSPKLLQQWQGPTFYLGKRMPWHGEKETRNLIAAAGPTVSHSALFVASQLGFSEILLSGVDLCYTESGSTHTQDSPEQYIQRMPSFCSAVVETYSGRMAASNEQLFQAIHVLDKLGELINRNSPIVFNLYNEAAKCNSIPFKGTEQVEINEVKPRLSDHTGDYTHFLNEKGLTALENELNKAKHSFQKMRGLCKKAKSLIKILVTQTPHNNTDINSNKLKKIRKEIENTYSDFLEAIIYSNGLAFSKTQLPTEFTDMSNEELLLWGKNYYTLIDKGAQDMIKLIDGVSPKIQLRRDELEPNIDIRTIAKNWREDGTPGRLLRWKKTHHKNIKGPDKAWVQRGIGKFRSTLNDTYEHLGSKIESDYSKFQTMLKSIEFLRNASKLNELKAIEPRMASDKWPYNALHSYICAVIRDLESNSVDANIYYQNTVDICSDRLTEKPDSLYEMQRLIEECLVRMTQCYMALDEQTSALTTLGLLCEMIPSYVVTYAKMLKLVGKSQYAIELLNSYVELYPKDKKARYILSNYDAESNASSASSNDQLYADKINGAMQAIMG